MYGAKQQSIGAFRAFYIATMNSCQVRLLMGNLTSNQHKRVAVMAEQLKIPHKNQQVHHYTCYVDGSTGIGLCFMQHGRVVLWVSKANQAISPAQAEARAVLEGFTILAEMRSNEGIVLLTQRRQF